jgi:hypothetical protein
VIGYDWADGADVAMGDWISVLDGGKASDPAAATVPVVVKVDTAEWFDHCTLYPIP